MTRKITKEAVAKALDSLESQLDQEDGVIKASEDDLDQPEGDDMGNPAKEKMSDAAKSKKMKKGDLKIEHEEDDEEDEDEDEDMKKKYKAMGCDKGEMMKKKSFAEELPEEVETKIEVSDFLKSLVGHTGSAIDTLAEYVAKSEEANSERYDELTGAVMEIQKSQAKIGVVLKAICERIGVIEAAPARVAKSQVVVKSEGRQFVEGVATNPATDDDAKPLFKSLSSNPLVAKSQIGNALCDMVKKGEADPMDVIGFESGGQLRPEIVTKLQAVL